MFVSQKSVIDGGSSLWESGSPDAWYQNSESLPNSMKRLLKANKKNLRSYWLRSLPSNIWKDIFFYIFLYYAIYLSIHRFFEADSEVVQGFEEIVIYFDDNFHLLSRDLLFLLGFYVSQIVKRWWEQFSALPSPDQLTAYCHALVDLSSEAGIQWARRFMRYALLGYVLCLRRISEAVREQFPDAEALILAGLATRRELQLLEEEADLGRVWHVPISWSMIMIRRAKQAGVEVAEKKELIGTVAKFQIALQQIDSYHHVVLPPLYRQVVKFAVYVYFMVAVIAEQELTKDPQLIIPIMLILKLIFFFGWLEVAKAIDDPWDGKDHEDFKIRELISRHFWSVGRSLQQEKAQLITLQTKA